MCCLSRSTFADVRFLAVHTATQFNPRALLSWERNHYNLTQPSRRAGVCRLNPAADARAETRRSVITVATCSHNSSAITVTEPGAHLCLCTRRQMLRNACVSTLNGAMRHIARRDNLPLVDLETLHLQLPVEHVYRVDGFHPRSNLLIQVCMNLLLNMYEQSTGSSVLGDA